MSQVRWITCKEFIATVAPKRHSHMFSREPREKIGREKRRVAGRLVHPGANLADQVGSQVSTETFFVVICAQVLGDRASIQGLIEGSFSKRDRERSYCLGRSKHR